MPSNTRGGLVQDLTAHVNHGGECIVRCATVVALICVPSWLCVQIQILIYNEEKQFTLLHLV